MKSSQSTGTMPQLTYTFQTNSFMPLIQTRLYPPPPPYFVLHVSRLEVTNLVGSFGNLFCFLNCCIAQLSSSARRNGKLHEDRNTSTMRLCDIQQMAPYTILFVTLTKMFDFEILKQNVDHPIILLCVLCVFIVCVKSYSTEQKTISSR